MACCAGWITCHTRGYAEAALDALSGSATDDNYLACGIELVLLRGMPRCCAESVPLTLGAGEAREPLDVLQAEVRVDSGKRAAAKMRKVSSEPTRVALASIEPSSQGPAVPGSALFLLAVPSG